MLSRDRLGREYSEIYRQGQGQERSVPPDGLRPSRLQELRPARQDHGRRPAMKCSTSSASRTIRCSTSRWSWSASRCTTIISSRRSSIRTSTSIRASPSRRWASRSSMFTVLFALARTVGWIAQWKEMIEDPSQKIGRPRQLYTGAPQREYVKIGLALILRIRKTGSASRARARRRGPPLSPPSSGSASGAASLLRRPTMSRKAVSSKSAASPRRSTTRPSIATRSSG